MRLNKRDLLKSGLATAVTAMLPVARPAAPAMAAGAAAPPRPPDCDAVRAPALQPDLFVHNDWFPQAREAARSRPEAVLAVAGDAGRLWYDVLRQRIAGGARRIAGLTTHTDLLILETLARDAGLRVRHRDSQGRLVAWVLS